MGEDYAPSGSFPTFPLSLIKDGETVNFDTLMRSNDPKRGLLAKLIDAVGWLRESGRGGLRSIATWVHDDEATADATWSFTTPAYAPNTTDPSAISVNVEAQAGDILVADMHAGIIVAPGFSGGYLRLGVTHAVTSGGAEQHMQGFAFFSAGVGVRLASFATVPAGGTSRVRLLGRTAGGPFVVTASSALRVMVFRPTSA